VGKWDAAVQEINCSWTALAQHLSFRCWAFLAEFEGH